MNPRTKIFFLIITIFCIFNIENNSYAQNSATTPKTEVTMADSFFSKGLTNYEQGNLESSLNYFLQSLKIYEKNGEKIEIANCYIKIGKINANLGNLSKTQELYNKALIIRKQYGNDDDIADAYISLGGLNGQMKNYDKALNYFNLSNKLFEKSGNRKGQIKTYKNTSLVYLNQEKYQIALEYAHKSLELAKELGTKLLIAHQLYNVAIIYREASDYENAILYFEKSLVLAKELKLKDYIKSIYYGLSNVNICLKDYKNAVIYLQRYNRMRDTLFNETTTRQIAEMQALYETEKKEQEIKIKDNEIKTQREKAKQKNIIIVLILIGLILSIVIFILSRRSYKNKQKAALSLAAKNEEINRQKIIDLLNKQDVSNFNSMMEGQEKERKRIAGELHDNMGSLLATVKLHFGSLENDIKDEKQFATVNSLLDKACDDVRNISHNLDSGILSKFGLISALSEIKQTLESTNKLKVNITTHGIDSRLNSSLEITLYRAVQELIGNIIKHANAKNISIELTRSNENLNLIIEDDGIGFDPTNKKGNGIGLKNLNSKIDSLNGIISIDSRIGDGTIIILDVPLKN